MSEYPQDVGKFALFQNEKRKAGTRQPDYTGSIEVPDGLPAGKYYLSGWKTPSKKDPKKVYLSGKIRPEVRKDGGEALATREPGQDATADW